MRRAAVVLVLAMLLAVAVTDGMLGGSNSSPPRGAASRNGLANEFQSQRSDLFTPEQQIRLLLPHLPGNVSTEDALGPAARWLLQEDQLTGTSLAQAPTSVEDVFSKLRQDLPYEPLPIPDVPEGPEPLLTAMTEYADVAGVELPDLAALRAQILSLRLQREAEDALAQLVRAYNQALQLEAEATQDLTAQELQLVARRPEAVQAWFAADSRRTPADLEGTTVALMTKVDVSDRLRAAELLLRTAEAVRETIALPPVPFVPGVHGTDALTLPWPGTGDATWDKLHQLTSLSTAAPPIALPELPPLDLVTSLSFLAHVLGIPLEDVLTPTNIASMQALPPSLSDAVATIVTARAFGFLMHDPVLHSRLLMAATQAAEPTLRAWAAVMDLNQVPHEASLAIDAQDLLRNVLTPSGTGLFTTHTAPQPPRLAVLLEREGLSRNQARSAQDSLPAPVALGTAYALDAIQRIDDARAQAFATLPPDERDAVDSGSARVAALLEGRDWSATEAALVEAWARGMARLSPQDLRGIQQAQADAVASIEAAAAILGAYATAPAGSWTLPIPESIDEPEGKVSWPRRVVDFVKNFQIIGTASAQPIPLAQCQDTAFSSCGEPDDVWFWAGGVLITGFGNSVVGPGLTGGGVPLLAIDLGGNDEYLMPVATTGPGAPARVAVDLGGSDTYRSNAPLGQAAADGSGTLAVLWDSEGDDTYTHTCMAPVCGAQGYGVAGGIGILFDGGGADTYSASQSRAQGVGWGVGNVGGTGLLLDRGAGNDVMRAARGQGYAEGQSSIGILVNDGDQSANQYTTTNPLVPRYQGGRSANAAAIGLLLDLGGRGTTYSNVQVPTDGWTYMSHDDDPLQGQRIRKDDALWLESSPTSGPGLGIDTRRGSDDSDQFDNWAELLAGSNPQDPESTPEDALTVQSLVDTVVGLLPNLDDINPDELVDPDNLPGPDDVNPETVQGLLNEHAQSFDVGLCYVPFDDEGACGIPMYLLHLGSSADDTIDSPALIIIEMGGADTYTTEVAGPGGFYVKGRQINVQGNQLDHQRIDGVGSFAIDLSGDDVYKDPGSPTQGAITLSAAAPERPSSTEPPVTVSNDKGTPIGTFVPPPWDGVTRPTIGYPYEEAQAPLCPPPRTNQLSNSSVSQAYLECMAETYWIPYAEAWSKGLQFNELRFNVRNPVLSPVSLLLEAGGNDTYEANANSQGAAAAESCGPGTIPASEAGINDAMSQAEGAAWLVDKDGDDNYTSGAASQGAVLYGAGQAGLIDLAGDDAYSFQTQANSDLVGPAFNGVCLPVPLWPKVALFYDAAGTDTYDNNNDAAPVVDPASLDPTQPATATVNNAAFLTQGIGRSQGAAPKNYVGIFLDDGPEHDTYLARGLAGAVDLSSIKNNALRPLQNGHRADGSGQGAGFFLDGPTGAASSDDHDGDCAPNALETATATDSNDADDHPGTIWMVSECGNDDGPLLQVRGRTQTIPLTTNTLNLQGLVIKGHENTTWTESQAFMVSLGGNNTYLSPATGSVHANTNAMIAFVMDAGSGDTQYLPTCTRIEDMTDLTLNVGAGIDLRCPSLGSAANRVAVLVDGGGNNVFHTNGTLRVRTNLDWDVTLATQGVGLNNGVGALVTWDASNRFTANMTVEVRQTQGQSRTPNVAVRGLAQGAGYAGGYGLLANLGERNGDDEYVSHLDVATDGPQIVSAHAQGAGQGLLLDGGGNNSFSASHPFAQAAGGILWSGTGNDRFTGRELSQGSSGILYDAGGNDEYVIATDAPGPAFSQGASLLGGTGLLVDVAGDDRYLAHGAALVQGAAVEGKGLLLDLGGNDLYVAGDRSQAYASGLGMLRAMADPATAVSQSGFYETTALDGVRGGIAYYGTDYALGNYTATLDSIFAYHPDLDRPTVVAEWTTGLFPPAPPPPPVTGPNDPPQKLANALAARAQFEAARGASWYCLPMRCIIVVSGNFPDWGPASENASAVASQAPTLAMLTDLHGNDVYEVAGRGQGFVDVPPGSDGAYLGYFIDAAGTDLYDHGSLKQLEQDLCRQAPCKPGNDWAWSARPLMDNRSINENQTLLLQAIGQAAQEANGASTLLAAATTAVTQTANDPIDGDELDAFNKEINGMATGTQEFLGAIAGLLQDDALPAVQKLAAQGAAIDPAKCIANANTNATAFGANATAKATACIGNATAIATAFIEDAKDLYNLAMDLRQAYGNAFTDHSAGSIQATLNELDQVLNRSFQVVLQAGNLGRAVATGPTDRSDRMAESTVEHFHVARTVGIDAATLDTALAALFAAAGIQVLPLKVVDQHEEEIEPEATAQGELSVRVRIQTPSNQTTDAHVDRVTISANGRVLGYALFNDTLSGENLLVYTYAWNTTSTTLPVAFPDADYNLTASVYMDSARATGSAAPPDLPAAESEPFLLTIDNPPVAWADLPKTLISPSGDPLPLRIHIGNDVAWPDGMSNATRAGLCAQRGAEPCQPGAHVQFTRANIADVTTRFSEIYFPAGSFIVPITATEGGAWADGTYRLRLKVEDHGGQAANDIELPIVTVDGTPPTAHITTPLIADESHSASGGLALELEWAFDDPDGSGVTGVCVVQLDEQREAMAGKVCRQGTSLAVDQAAFGAETGDVLHFAIAAVDLAGNTDSPCRADLGEGGLAPPFCIADKVARHNDAAPTIRSITVDFNAPQILEVKVDGLAPKDAFLQPGAPANITARITDVGTQIISPGRVQILLPVLDAAGRVSTNPLTGDMKTDGLGNYWYDEWHLHNEMHAEPRHDELGFTIRATDRAGNVATEAQRLTLDSLPPIVLPEETTTYVQGKGTEEEKTFQTGKPGLLAEVRARVLDAAMSSMRLNVTELTGSPETKPCTQDTASPDPNMWVCPLQLPGNGLPDGDYTVRFNATDQAGNVQDNANKTLHVRGNKLTFANITVDQVTHDSFRVNWTTPFEGTSQVAFGVSGLLGQTTPTREGYRREHSVEVTGLQPSTPYFFHVISENTAGVQSNSSMEPTPVRTLNAYTFELNDLPQGQTLRSLVTLGYELHLKTTGPGVKATLLVQDAGADVDPFELEVATLEHGQGNLTVNTTQFADGQYRLLVKLDRAGDRMEVASPLLRIDNTEPVIALVSPRPSSTLANTSSAFEVQLIDPMGHAPPLASTLRVEMDNRTVTPIIHTDEVLGASSLQRRVKFTLPTPLAQGARELNLSVLDDAGNEGLAKWRFVVDSLPPQRGATTNITYQPGPAQAKPGGQALVILDLDDPSDVASASLNLSPLMGSGNEVPLVRTPGGRWTATIDIPANAPNGTVDLPLNVTDTLDNRGPAGTVRFIIDAAPPTITAASVSTVNYTSATVNLTTDEPTRAWHGNDPGPADDQAWLLQHTLQLSGLKPGQDHQVPVHVMDNAGNAQSKTVSFHTVEDTSPPSNVTGLQSTSPGEGVVMLSWGAATDNAGVASYRINRSFAPDVSIGADAERVHRDEAAPAGQAVTYRIVAIDVAGNVGPISELKIQVLALPHLSNATVTPLRGPSHEPFTFQVNYSHASGAPADLVTVTVRGTIHVLELTDPPTGGCRDACVYRVRLLLPPSSLFDTAGGATFRATAGDHQDSLILDESPLVRRSGQSGGIFDMADGEATPGPNVLATLLTLAIAAILFSRQQRRTQ